MIFKLMYLIDLNVLNLMVCLSLHINCNYIDRMTSLGTVKFKFILKEFFLNLQHKHDPNAWYDTNYSLP